MKVEGHSLKTYHQTLQSSLPPSPVVQSNSTIEFQTPSRTCCNISHGFLRLWHGFTRTCGKIYATIIRYIKWVFSLFCPCLTVKLPPPLQFICGNYSQFNAIYRSSLCGRPPGSYACGFAAAQAALLLLTGQLKSSSDIDLAVIRGVGNMMAFYGCTLPPRMQQMEDPIELRVALQEVMNQRDCKGEEFNVPTFQFRDWEDISPHIPELTLDERYYEETFISGNRLEVEELTANNRQSEYVRMMNNLIRLPDSVQAALFVSPPNTYALSIRKDVLGQVQEVVFFDSHGSVNANYNAAYRKFNTIEEAATYIANLTSYCSSRATLVPVCLNPACLRNASLQ